MASGPVLRHPDLFELEAVFEWDFTRAREVQRLEPSGDTTITPRPLGARLRGRPVRIARAVSWSTSDIDALEITYRGGKKVPTRIRWWGGTGGPGGGLEQRHGEGVATAERTYRFYLRDHAEWKGEVSRLAIVAQPGGGPLTLTRVRGLRLAADGPASPEGRVDVAGEVRDGWLLASGLSREFPIEVGPGARLVMGLALTAGQGEGWRFLLDRVVGEGADAEVARVGGLEVREAAWKDLELEVPEGRWTLRVSAEPLGEGDLRDGIPISGRPILRRAPAEARRPNVLLVSIDTLRADHVSAYGYPHPTTPRLDAWAARRAVRFDQAITPASWTLPAHVSLFTGIHPLEHGMNHAFVSMPQEMSTLAETLRREGYVTAAVTGGGWLSPDYGLDQGFERFVYWPEVERSEGELAAGVSRAAGWMRGLPEPWMIFLHTFDLHDYGLRRAKGGGSNRSGLRAPNAATGELRPAAPPDRPMGRNPARSPASGWAGVPDAARSHLGPRGDVGRGWGVRARTPRRSQPAGAALSGNSRRPGGGTHRDPPGADSGRVAPPFSICSAWIWRRTFGGDRWPPGCRERGPAPKWSRPTWRRTGGGWP